MPLSEENSNNNIINFNVLFYESPQPMWIVDNNTLQFLEVNESAIRTYGYTKAEFMRMSLRDIWVGGEHPTFKYLNMSGNEPFTVESHHCYKNLERRYVEVTTFPFLFNNQRCRLSYIRDISVKKKRQALLEYLIQAGEELALEVNTQTVLQKISDLIVPKFADWFTINLIRGDQVDLLLVKNQDPEYIKWAHEHRRKNPITIQEGGLTGHVIRTGESNLTPVVTLEMLEQAITDKEQLEVIKKLNLRSSIVTPMKVNGKVIGTINFISTVEGRQFDEIDLKFSQDFATRIGLALENARLHEEAKHSFEELKKAETEAQAMNEELTAINEELSASNDQLLAAHYKVQESEERFRTMAEDTDVLIAVADESSNGVYFNKAWQKLTGKSSEELMKYGWAELIHPDDKERWISTYLAAFAKRSSLSGEFRILSKTGEYRWLLARVPARFHPDGTFAGYISSCIDITELKNNEQRKNDFIGMVSHELKTPLTSLSALVQVSAKKLIESDDRFLKDAMDKANVQVKKMAKLINGFLNISRLESGKMAIEKTRFDLKKLVEEIVNEAELTASSGQIHLHLCEQITIYADREKIGSVISNLLSNALKYSPSGEPVELSCETSGDSVKVSVKDKGMGISDDDKEKLFDRYYRVESKNTKHIAGFGIGLYLSSEIIKRHDGQIGVESEYGEGSTFYFTLPNKNL